MISPSARSTSRSTPWVLGCCGPMLTSISSVRTTNSTTVWSSGRGVGVAMMFVALRVGCSEQACVVEDGDHSHVLARMPVSDAVLAVSNVAAFGVFLVLDDPPGLGEIGQSVHGGLKPIYEPFGRA